MELHYLNLAVKAAKSAGEVIKNSSKQINSQVAKDIKLQTDVEAELAIIEILKPLGFPILGEESGLNFGENIASMYWIVDPLDGTLNFLRGLPIYCVSIALWKGQDPILGVIYDCSRDTMYSGIVGRGAELDGESINVSNTSLKSHAVITTGFPVYSSFDSTSLSSFISSIQNYKKVRLLGSAAISLAYVAAGFVDAYEERNIAFWDVAAGIAIVKAAGGVCNYTFTDEKKYLLDVFCNNGKLE
jgi:myo-inositol-1(or 4)-monophosphatase